MGFGLRKLLAVMMVGGLASVSSAGVFAADGTEGTHEAFEAEHQSLIEAGETELANELKAQFEAYEHDPAVQASVVHELEGSEKAAEHLREAVDRLAAEGKTDQADKLNEVLGKLENGELTLEQCELEVREIVGDEWRDDLLVGPPVEMRTDENLPPEVRTQLEKLFDEKGTGDPTKDQHVREEAERILREYGIDPREMGPGHEGWEHGGEVPIGIDHDFHSEWDNDSLIRGSEGDLQAVEQPVMEHAFEAPQLEFEAIQHEYEPAFHEYEAPVYEQGAPEPQYHEYDAPPPQP